MSFGIVIIVAGLALDLAVIRPMLKWISTSSFVLVTGGISLIACVTNGLMYAASKQP